MPRYEYECPAGHRDEVLRPVDMRDDELECAAWDDGPCVKPMRRVFQSPGMSIEGRAYKEYTGDVNDWLANS